MAEIRTITLHLSATEKTLMAERVGSQELFKALGYLGTWNMTFPHVDIYSDGETDLVASYKCADGSRGYTIGAIWNAAESRYGFHS